MINFFKLFYLSYFFLTFNFGSQAQELNYEIIWREDSIGSLTAYRMPDNAFLKYVIESEVSVKFIGRLDMVYFFENVFSNEVLVKASTQNTSNNKVKSSSELKWDGKGYLASVDGKEVNVPGTPIKASMATLYFYEPKDLKEIFSERFVEYCTISEVSPQKYELILPNGRKNYYTYQNGICTLVEVNHAMATFYFKLRKNDGKAVVN